MTREDFLNFIVDINRKRTALFSDEIKEKIHYNDICINSENADKKEKLIIKKCNELDAKVNLTFWESKNLSDDSYDREMEQIKKIFKELEQYLEK